MLENYLIVHKSILPDKYAKVLEARRLLETGLEKEVSQAVRRVGISLPRNSGILHWWNGDKSRNILGRIVFFLHLFKIKCHKITS